ncbi:Gluconokinase [Microbacterium esteraromaticum]|uniref:Gluconokinase n=1 Tax=Microbacterium esteraromaticum TaxID=57043 RepID=A0A1R4IPU0_9MICO|nr:gluconokinase [Microbacterium esteraromaticum]SJN21674.1 Gluconokinase [Microbacterium esteraromaticum]
MTPDAQPETPIVVMGVSGVGKTTLGKLLAERLGMPFIDADDLHSAANIAKMSAGNPLTDEDRAPWLDRVGDTLAAFPTPVIACSALKDAYRDALRAKAPTTQFIELTATPEKIAEMAAGRTGHFMPTSLLSSQLDTLEPLDPDENGMIVTVDAPPEELADRVLTRLRQK